MFKFHDRRVIVLTPFTSTRVCRLVVITFARRLIGRCDRTATRQSYCSPSVEKRPFKPLLDSERHNKPSYHQSEVVDDVWTLLICRYVCRRWSTGVECGDDMGHTCRAGHATKLGSRCVITHFVSVALEKSEGSSISRPLIVNIMDNPTIVKTKMKF